MKYELAKELKEVGFPQNDPKTHFPEVCQYEEKKPSDCYISTPTLEELIEACGEGVFTLYSTPANKKWEATITRWEQTIRGEGSSAIEAVARLWLALNKVVK